MSNYFEKVPVSGSARFLSTRPRCIPETSRRVEMSTAVFCRPAASSAFSLVLERRERKNVQYMRFCDLREEASGSKVVGVTIRVNTLSFLR